MIVKSGPEFFDTPKVFDQYQTHRQQAQNLNDLLELPILRSLLPPIVGQVVLDLGCGDGRFCDELMRQGAHSVHGIDGSEQMISVARKQFPALQFTCAYLEVFAFPVQQYDLVVSRLALHYIADVGRLFQQVHQSLKSGGTLAFSVEHPCLTAGPTDWTQYQRDQVVWQMDDYFVEGEREVTWMGDVVRKYHRSLESYVAALQQVGFTITALKESRPDPRIMTDPQLYRRMQRMPVYLFLKAARL